MWLFWLDLCLFEVCLFVLYLNSKRLAGFKTILVPYTVLWACMIYIPLIITVVNIISTTIVRDLFAFGLLPLVLPVSYLIGSEINKILNIRFFNKKITPTREEVKSFMNTKGFVDLARVSVIAKKRKLKGEIIIELFEEDFNQLEVTKEELFNALRQKYTGFSIYLYTNHHKKKPQIVL